MTTGETTDVQRTGELVRALLARATGHVHLVGVCGVGMAGVATLLKQRGFRVSGCDVQSNPLGDWLVARGVRVDVGHDASHIRPDVEWVVRSAAVPSDAPELLRARELGVPVVIRGAVLPELLAGRLSIAVSGTHGKTTTSTFITQLLAHAGRDPSWCIGGESPDLGGVAGEGKGGILVVEADESDGTVACYVPDIAVVTNVEFDHMEHFAGVADFEACFASFVAHARRRVVYCADDARATALCRGVAGALSYGLSPEADVSGSRLRESASSLSFELSAPGGRCADITLPVPGRHNALNALAAAAVGLEAGLDLETVRRGLARVTLPGRRFQRIVSGREIEVISDYAHHPSEIAALVATARCQGRARLVAVFQPHRFTRTLALGEDFPPAFKGVDELVLVPVYAASEAPLKGGTTWDLYRRFRALTPVGAAHAADGDPDVPAEAGPTARSVRVAGSLEHAWWYLKRILKPGDLLLIVGAGDVGKLAEWAERDLGDGQAPLEVTTGADADGLKRLLTASEVREDEPLAAKTTLGVGGPAEVWVEVGRAADLAALLEWTHRRGTPFRVLGAGSNVLVSDLGVPGVTARLSGDDFRRIRKEENEVVAGAGVPLSRLLQWLEDKGLPGLEFLEGIPGTVGGALRMNAGAWGEELGRHVSWIRCLNLGGTEHIVRAADLNLRYRGCGALTRRVVVDVGLTPGEGGPEGIGERRAEFRRRRAWLNGLRSAGSVFRNPAGGFAGRLVESVGLKGKAVGGAVVSPAHANVLTTVDGACASDVAALIEWMRAEVADADGVDLATEIVFWE